MNSLKYITVPNFASEDGIIAADVGPEARIRREAPGERAFGLDQRRDAKALRRVEQAVAVIEQDRSRHRGQEIGFARSGFTGHADQQWHGPAGQAGQRRACIGAPLATDRGAAGVGAAADAIAGHAAGGDQLIHQNALYQANWWTQSIPGSDSSWTQLCSW